MLAPRNLSPGLLDLGKGHKSDGDVESPPSASQVKNVPKEFEVLIFKIGGCLSCSTQSCWPGIQCGMV